jgi:hypothetical protein
MDKLAVVNEIKKILEVLPVVLFRYVALCNLGNCYHVSEERGISIFRVEVLEG